MATEANAGCCPVEGSLEAVLFALALGGGAEEAIRRGVYEVAALDVGEAKNDKAKEHPSQGNEGP
eukprot:5148575-Lingulodinium_polyedra.AAC.1